MHSDLYKFEFKGSKNEKYKISIAVQKNKWWSAMKCTDEPLTATITETIFIVKDHRYRAVIEKLPNQDPQENFFLARSLRYLVLKWFQVWTNHDIENILRIFLDL